MTPSAERWAAVTRLFDELVELEPDARAGRLAAVGAADPDLRTEVERLLAADADADRRLAGVRVPFAAEPPARDPLGLAGSTLSHFRVIEPLGSGGMGVVYRAEDTRLERTVALKLPHAEHRLDTSWRERFLREGRSAAALDHPNLCQIYEVGETSDGRPFLAMPLYPGETLQARLEREGPLPVPVALAIAREIAAGLAALREAGIAHRDLKPGNVMLLPDGRVRILDFGLARAKDVTLTDAGVRQGTVAYMSPEQVRGDDVDGRADLWALGVVLYEMLTGRRPFDGDHYVSVAHAIVHEAPARPSALRRGLGAPVERLVLGLLDKDPASREPASRALLEGHPLPSRRPRWRRVAAVGGVLGALAVGWGLRNGAREPAAVADPNLIAVAPFDVPDPALELWREGMVDILSRDLDRAGPLRTVAQSVALARWAGRADPASAGRLGERTGAGLVVFGSVLRRGADSVSLRAALLDHARGEQGPDLEVVGEERRVGELADSLAVLILRSLGADRPIGSVRRVSIGSRSLPALKAFLAGEQRYRRGDWDSALVQYGRAVAADSTFGLALRRMGYVIGWGPASSGDYLGAATYLERSVLFGRGLSRRESLLFTAESLSVALAAAADPDSLIRHAFAAVAALEEAARRYPDDPEVWYHLGEVLTHWSPPLGGRPAAALDAFERAVTLDSGFTPAYEHTVELAMQLRMPERAMRYARAYAARNPTEASAEALRLVALVFDFGGVAAPAVAAAVRAAPANTISRVYDHLQWWTDSAETAIALRRSPRSGRHDVTGAPPFVADSLMWGQYLAHALAFRGRLREAVAAHGRLLVDPGAAASSAMSDPFLDLALLGAVPDTAASREFAKGLARDASWDGYRIPRYLRGLPWWLARRDTAAIVRFAGRAAEVEREASAPRARLRARYLRAAAAGYLALARADTADAVRRLAAIPDTLCVAGTCFAEKLLLARLQAAMGDDRSAAAVLDRWMWVEGSTPSFVLAALERARIAERLDDRPEAVRWYRLVTEVWRRADPGLRPYVAEANGGLERLAVGATSNEVGAARQ